MRTPQRWFKVLGIAAALTLCASIQKAQDSPTPEQIARRAIEEVWNKGIFDANNNLMAPTSILHYRGQSIPLTPESAANIVQTWRAGFPDFTFRIEDSIFVSHGAIVPLTVGA